MKLLTRLPSSNLGSCVTQRTNGGDQAFPHDRVHQQASLGPPGAPGAAHGHFRNRAKRWLILEQYQGVFERYVFSPSVNIDDGWTPVKKYIEEREQAYWDEWDQLALRRIIQQQRKITEASKKLEMKKMHQVLIIIEDYADSPQLHKSHGALDTLFIRGRHTQKQFSSCCDSHPLLR